MDRVVEPQGVLALIPARGGSRAIPRKNVRLLGGHPLLAYSIAAARQAAHVSRVIVSTDDGEAADISRQYGAEVPFMRPAELATDEATDLQVFEHVLGELESREQYLPGVIVQLRPTSPFRPPGLVDRAIDLLRRHEHADSVRAITSSKQNPYKMWTMRPDGALAPLLSTIHEAFNQPRQQLPRTFSQTGHVDVMRRATIVRKRSMTGETILPVEVDAALAIDLDTPADWDFAEYLAAGGRLEIVRPDATKRGLPARVSLVVLDFDGVFTDNRVWTDEDGRESVASNRSDGLGLAELRRRGVKVIVLSTEPNPVVAARCRKLGIEYLQDVADKPAALAGVLAAGGVPSAEAIFVGNDINDVGCFAQVACAFAVNDAHEAARRAADRVLAKAGGHGAVRELCDLIVAHVERRPQGVE
jgi:N-acylneuraminate cytidylyltransferase